MRNKVVGILLKYSLVVYTKVVKNSLGQVGRCPQLVAFSWVTSAYAFLAGISNIYISLSQRTTLKGYCMCISIHVHGTEINICICDYNDASGKVTNTTLFSYGYTFNYILTPINFPRCTSALINENSLLPFVEYHLYDICMWYINSYVI